MDKAKQLLLKVISFTSEPLQLKLNHEVLNFLHKNREKLLVYYDQPGRCRQLGDDLAANTTKMIHERNQFVNLSPQEMETLAHLYTRFVQGILNSLTASASVAALTDRLAENVEEYSFHLQRCLAAFRDYELLSHSLQQEPVTCAQYSPELQLHLLGLDEKNIVEPILDLGCGERGQLVHHLRALGYEAFGVDRHIQEGPYLIKADWLQMRWESQTLGTVISHMAFSNHFIHHHLRKDGHPEVYAKMFMRILNALTIGGSFCYTPGLSFIEKMLPTEKYRVMTVQDEQQKGFYSTRITRLQ